MSDFLTRMARLSHGKASVVTPRPPSLFAPTEPSSDIEPMMPLLTPQRPADTKLPEQNERLFTSSTSETDDPRPAHIRQARTGTFVSDRPQPATQEMASDPAPKTSQRESGGVPFVVQSPQVSDSQTVAFIRQHSVDQASMPTLSDKIETIVQSSVDLPLDRSVDFAGVTEPGVTQRSLPLVPNHKNRQTLPSQRMAELPSDTVNQQATVHINIGRIEVRAQHAAPTPAARPIKNKPRNELSLNDYLKRGRGRT
jgi:hypothetical protein